MNPMVRIASQNQVLLDRFIGLLGPPRLAGQNTEHAVGIAHRGYLRIGDDQGLVGKVQGQEGTPLYPGASETELCPTTTFEEAPIYKEGQEPDAAERESRRRDYWQPYHLALAQLLLQAKDRYGIAVLWDAHSIPSRVPRFFDGRLPDLNLGSRDGASCDGDLLAAVTAAAEAGRAHGFSHVVDGRFKGGFITRSYGRPAENTHALQLELAMATYMEEGPPWTFREDRAERLRPVLREMLTAARDWALARART
jgi:N-formylglutamate amidohydrolase